MVPPVLAASVLDVAVSVAAVALLIGIAVQLLNAFRRRGVRGEKTVPPLVLVQKVAATLALVSIATSSLTNSDVAYTVFMVCFAVVLAVALVQWRRGHAPFAGF